MDDNTRLVWHGFFFAAMLCVLAGFGSCTATDYWYITNGFCRIPIRTNSDAMKPEMQSWEMTWAKCDPSAERSLQ